MADFRVEGCKSCGASVIWAVTPAAKPMPVDAEPVKDGNVQLEHRGDDMTPLARVLPVAKQFGKAGQLRKSHFATCPQAGKWRRRG